MSWTCVTLTDEFVSEGCCFGDIDSDGALELVAGEQWWKLDGSQRGTRFRRVTPEWLPDWTPLDREDPTPHLRRGGGPPRYRNATYDWAVDLTGSGTLDVVGVGMHTEPIRWFENTGADVWPVHTAIPGGGVYEAVSLTSFPTAPVALVTVPVKPYVAWYTPRDDPRLPWTSHLIGGRGGDWHGLSVADVDGDGLPEVLTRDGFFHVSDSDPTRPWSWTPAVSLTDGKSRAGFGEEVWQLSVVGHNDDGGVILFGGSPHGYGAWAWERVDVASNGTWVFRQTMVNDSISQLHGLATIHVRDGWDCVVTGKRPLAHGRGRDDGWEECATVIALWFHNGRLVATEVVDHDAGVGLGVAAQLGDGVLRVGVASRNGVRYFERGAEPPG